MWLDNASDIDILFYDPYAQLISSIAKDKINSSLTIGVLKCYTERAVDKHPKIW